MQSKDKEYIENLLKQYPRRDRVLKKFDLDIEEIKLDDGMSAVCYDGDGVQTSNINKMVENLAIRKEEEIEKILKMKKRKEIHFDKIEIALEELTDLEQKLIEYRYFKGYTFDMCADNIGYSVSRCKCVAADMIKTFYSGYKIRE